MTEFFHGMSKTRIWAWIVVKLTLAVVCGYMLLETVKAYAA